jgi:hypothetical protein
MKIEEIGEKKYMRNCDKAIEFHNYDKNGLPIIKAKVTKKKDKNGKDRIIVLLFAF